MGDAATAELIQQYIEGLAELTFNSKPTPRMQPPAPPPSQARLDVDAARQRRRQLRRQRRDQSVLPPRGRAAESAAPRSAAGRHMHIVAGRTSTAAQACRWKGLLVRGYTHMSAFVERVLGVLQLA